MHTDLCVPETADESKCGESRASALPAGRKKKEQEVEAHLFGDKPVYVTNAYRKHQEEQAKYEAELNKKCASPPIARFSCQAVCLHGDGNMSALHA